ncbi:MAG: hypothetical protein FWB72_05380 [Firmicutes bacterium]|nr:hypothetical protein [Bacillota bacterium]
MFQFNDSIYLLILVLLLSGAVSDDYTDVEAIVLVYMLMQTINRSAKQDKLCATQELDRCGF